MLKRTLLCLLFVPTLSALFSVEHQGGQTIITKYGGFDGRDGCFARVECETNAFHEYPSSIKLYHDTTLLAEMEGYPDQQECLRDKSQRNNAGALVNKNKNVAFPWNDTCSYVIFPVQAKDLGRYVCVTVVRTENNTMFSETWNTLAFDRCCKASGYRDTAVGVWSRKRPWSYGHCNDSGCVEERWSPVCLTDHCEGGITPNFETRFCFNDDVCDETDRIKIDIVTAYYARNKRQCLALVNCKVDEFANVTSVQLFHVWGPSKRSRTSTGFTDLKYSGRLLLAEATVGVNGGRFTEAFHHPNGEVFVTPHGDPQLCSCTSDCGIFHYMYKIMDINYGNEGDYACVVNPGGTNGDNWSAKLKLHDNCIIPGYVGEAWCKEDCLEKNMVAGYEWYIQTYCHKLCTVKVAGKV